MSSVLPIYQKHAQMGSQLIQLTWIMNLLFSGPVLLLTLNIS